MSQKIIIFRDYLIYESIVYETFNIEVKHSETKLFFFLAV